jgi:hypothetical protein
MNPHLVSHFQLEGEKKNPRPNLAGRRKDFDTLETPKRAGRAGSSDIAGCRWPPHHPLLEATQLRRLSTLG